MLVKIEKGFVNDTRVIKISGNAYPKDWELLQHNVKSITEENIYKVVVDLSKAGFVSDACLEIIKELRNQCGLNNGRLVLVNAKALASKRSPTRSISKISKTFQTYTSRADALNSFK